jgi:hypothetical protein
MSLTDLVTWIQLLIIPAMIYIIRMDKNLAILTSQFNDSKIVLDKELAHLHKRITDYTIKG